MKICIYGAGAIGGLIGARLALAGHDVSAVARGATAAALRAKGWRLESGGRIETAPVRVAKDPWSLGVQDAVIVAVKGPAMTAVAAGIGGLLGSQTPVVTAMNGVPWWFSHGMPDPFADRRLQTIDPDGAIAAAIPVERVIGSVLHMTCSCPEPGLVRHGAGDGILLGEPSGERTPRVAALAAVLRQSGFAAEVPESIRRELWYKLWGNMTLNPISALTGATVDRILDDPLLDGFCRGAMQEAAAIGARIGCPIGQSGAERNAVTRKLGAFKTSMQRDAEAGKPLEIDALLTAVHEMGGWTGVPTPYIGGLLGLTRVFAQTRGLYGDTAASAS